MFCKQFDFHGSNAVDNFISSELSKKTILTLRFIIILLKIQLDQSIYCILAAVGVTLVVEESVCV